MPLKDDWQDGDAFSADDMNDVATAVNDNTSAIAGKADAAHSHSAADITSGTLNIARIPTGNSAQTVCIGNDARLSDTRTPTDNTVSTAKIQDGAVTEGKIASNAVSTAKIQDGAVTTDKLSVDVLNEIASLILSARQPTVQTVTSASSVVAILMSARHRVLVTALAQTATFIAPAAESDGWQLVYRIKDNGTARTLNWDAVFRPMGVELPTTTTANKTIYVACEYNAADSKWDVLAVAEEA